MSSRTEMRCSGSPQPLRTTSLVVLTKRTPFAGVITSNSATSMSLPELTASLSYLRTCSALSGGKLVYGLPNYVFAGSAKKALICMIDENERHRVRFLDDDWHRN